MFFVKRISPACGAGVAACICAALACAPLGAAAPAFNVDSSPVPASHHAIAPADGTSVSLNPPSMVWREDKTAASYIVELSRDGDFPKNGEVIRVEGVELPFYNHNRVLEPGKWFWRYFVVRADGRVSNPGQVRSFIVGADAEPFAVPPVDEIFLQMPPHPRIFVTPQTLETFRQKRDGVAAEQWDALKRDAERALGGTFELRGRRVALAEAKIEHNADSISPTWKPGQPVRRQVFYQDGAGELFWLPENSINLLNAAAARLDTLSFAWQISQDERYLEAARALLALLAPLRVDAHLPLADRAEHDTVVYAYENGLKAMAVAYDRMYHELNQAERDAVLGHIEYHVEPAGQWLKKVQIHTSYQISHPQQCMHALLVTLLATAKDSPKNDTWLRYIFPQYINRIAWTSEDGGYFEGQTYAHKFSWILEGLAAIRSATGVDLFKKPEIRNSGEFWLYAMNLNYWFQHWGDNYSLVWPYANHRDAHITAVLAAMNNDPYVKWYSQTVLTDPQVNPFDYLAADDLPARPPVDLAQARLFPLTGVATAYNGLHDHSSERLFFRSSPWGSHSHSHADQNAFVIHAGGEILAADPGYYTYHTDAYDLNWSKATFSHNTILVNGKPQGRGIGFKGGFTSFFHGAGQTYFVGDASGAYGKPLDTFRRAVLFIRPSVYVVYDELKAAEPSTYSWLLNVFQKPLINEAERKITVEQRHMRMDVYTLLPAAVNYSASAERPHPIKDPKMAWSRFTEAFPQPWHIRVENSQPARSEAFLTLMETWDSRASAPQGGTRVFEDEHSLGLEYKITAVAAADASRAGGAGVVVFARNLGGSAPLSAGQVGAHAQAASLLQDAKGRVQSWLIASGTRLSNGDSAVFTSESAISASADFNAPAAAALLQLQGRSDRVTVRLDKKPSAVFIAAASAAGQSQQTQPQTMPLQAQPSKPQPSQSPQTQQAQRMDFSWDEAASSIVFPLDADKAVTVWVEPFRAPSLPLPAGAVEFTDSRGSYTVPLQSAWTERGEIMYFAEVMPREAGSYTIRQRGAEGGAEAPAILVQDRWDPYNRSSRGNGVLSGDVRDGSWLYFTVAPESTPKFTATLDEKVTAGAVDNILFNGDFESGIPNYPPRGWTLGFGRGDSESWFNWTQAEARSGKSSVQYVRDRNDYNLISRPMRLLKAGEYRLRFYAKGNVTNANVSVRGAQGRRASVNINAGEQWQLHETQVNLPAGYTTIFITIPAGPKGDVLWIDDMEFGLIPNP